MRRRAVYLMLAVLVVGGVLVGVFARREREPEYGGKRLSEWVDPTYWGEYRFSQGNSIQGMPSEVADAIRHTGTNAVPYLLSWIRYEPPAWKRKSFTIINRLFHSAPIDHEARRADGAIAGFSILGEK